MPACFAAWPAEMPVIDPGGSFENVARFLPDLTEDDFPTGIYSVEISELQKRWPMHRS